MKKFHRHKLIFYINNYIWLPNLCTYTKGFHQRFLPGLRNWVRIMFILNHELPHLRWIYKPLKIQAREDGSIEDQEYSLGQKQTLYPWLNPNHSFYALVRPPSFFPPFNPLCTYPKTITFLYPSETYSCLNVVVLTQMVSYYNTSTVLWTIFVKISRQR